MSKKSKKRRQETEIQEVRSGKPFSIPFVARHPDVTAMIGLALLLLAFYAPVMLTNNSFLPPDSVAAKSFQPFVKDALKEHVYPLWNPYIYCGMPSFASLSMAPYVEVVGTMINGAIDGVRHVIPLTDFTRFFINFFIFAGLVYLLLRVKKLGPGPAFFGAAAMVFIPQVVAYAVFGHSSKLTTASMIPLVFLVVDRLLEKQNLLYLCLAGLTIGLQWLRLHVQIAFYTHLMIGLYVIFWIVWTLHDEKKPERVLKGIGMLLVAYVAGFLLPAVINGSVWEYSHYSIRGGGETGGLSYDYATAWSFSPVEIALFLIPSFFGFGDETYWGPMPFTNFPQYFGLVVLTLAALSMVVRRNRITVFFAVLAGFTLLLSFGKHLPILFGPMFKLFPFFDKFRAPNMIHVIFEFSMVVLAAHGLEGLIAIPSDGGNRKARSVRRILLGIGLALGILMLVLFLMRNAYLGWAQSAQESRYLAYDKAVKDGVIALVLFGVTAGLVLMAMKRWSGSKIRPAWIVLLFCLVSTADLWIVDRKFSHPRPTAEEGQYFAETSDVRFLKSQPGIFRIFGVGDQRSPNWYMYHKIQHIGGYQGAKLRIYQEFIDTFLWPNGFPKRYIDMVGGRAAMKPLGKATQEESVALQAFFRMTNVKYVVSPFGLTDLDSSLVLVSEPGFKGQNAVFEYKGFLPRVFFAREVLEVQGKDAVLGYLSGGKFDPARTAVIEEKPPFAVTASNNNRAEILSYGIQNIRIRTSNDKPGLLVLSDAFYPAGWTALVDGREQKIFKTNAMFRSVFLQSGEHDVVFDFRPRMFRTGLWISLVTAGVLVAGTGLGLVLNRKRKKSREVSES